MKEHHEHHEHGKNHREKMEEGHHRHMLHERHHRAAGGRSEEGGADSDDPKRGRDDAEEDLRDRNMDYTYQSKVSKEAEEKKHGGHVRRRRRHGGEVHHSACKCEKCMGGKAEHKAHGGEAKHHKERKHVGKVEGHHAHHHSGHTPRKRGGRTGSDHNPLTSAAHGVFPRDHKPENDLG